MSGSSEAESPGKPPSGAEADTISSSTSGDRVSADGPQPFADGDYALPRPVVEVDEQHETGPRRALVAIGQRVIPRDPTREHRGLVVHV